jgi:hypothetical protein
VSIWKPAAWLAPAASSVTRESVFFMVLGRAVAVRRRDYRRKTAPLAAEHATPGK